MINQKQMIHVLTEEIRKVMGCEIVKSNQVHKKPRYPYLSFSITTSVHAEGGTYCEDEHGTRFRDLLQTWSFTVMSNQDSEANEIALQIFDWLGEQGTLYLNDNGIVVEEVGDITNRDNMISIEYEYRYGFDVKFRMRHIIEKTKEEQDNIINEVEFKQRR